MKRRLKYTFGLIALIGITGIIFLDIQVRSKFEGSKWRLPSLVYGKPVELFEGALLEPSYLTKELLESGYELNDDLAEPGQFSVTGDSYGVYRRAFDFGDSKEDAALISFRLIDGVVFDLQSQGEAIDLLRLEPLLLGGVYPHNFEDRKLIKLTQVPQHLIDALITVEDQNFYHHWGVSPKGIVRASLANLKAGRVVEGASTLTQQLVKNFYLSSERSFKRKILEALYSLLLEVHYSKDEIIEAYLNEVYLAQNGRRAIHGFGLASEFYFNKSIQSLSLSESAMLVALVNGPSYYNPRRHPERCLKRRNKVLRMMFNAKKINEISYQDALSEAILIPPKPKSKSIRYPAYLDLVKRHLSRDYERSDLEGEGLRIFTTFSPQSQWAAEESLAETMKSLGNVGKKLEGAMLVANTAGDVEAVLGGKERSFQGFNRALDSKRSIGSMVKPAIVLAALKSGRYDLNSFLQDEELTIPLENEKTWSPKNYDGESHGQVPMYRAIANSYNQAMVRLGLDLGTAEVAKVLKSLGAEGDIPENPAMLLGAFGLSPYEMMKIFQTISSDGFQVLPRTVRYVMGYNGQVLQAFPPQIQQVVEPELLHLLKYALQMVMYEGTGKSVYRTMSSSLLAAGKTGTTNDLRDSWFSGFTGDKLAVVWMGRDDNKKASVTGASGALQVWAKLMNKVSRRPLGFTRVKGVDYHWVDEATGQGSFAFCQGVRKIPFLEGREPKGQAQCVKSLKPVVDWFKKLFE